MYIKFKNAKICGFQAIKTANIDFDSQGTVLVRGINKYEDKANSNGSGKSSCFESILWALYGKTSSGVTDVTNRFYNRECYVDLELDIDSNNYRIIRSIKSKDYGSGIKLYHNDTDISCKNKSDTDKLIREIIPFSQDVFMSTVFLSQGFSSRISTLTPSGRKERIESLTGIAEKVESFKNEISSIKSNIGDKVTSASNILSYQKGCKESNISNIESLTNKLNVILKEVPEDIDVDSIKDEITNLKSLIDDNKTQKSKISTEYASNVIIQNNSKQQSTTIENKIVKIRSNIDKLCASACPTCGTILGKEKIESLKEQYITEMSEEKAKLLEIDDKIAGLQVKIDTNKAKLTEFDSSISILTTKLNELDTNLNKFSNYSSIDTLKAEINELKANVLDISREITENTELYEKLSEDLSIATHCLTLVTKSFRTYLLENIINFVNSKLKVYSDMLFSNDEDVIRMDTDSTKLTICLGESLYETLSGGEKRKVDIALTFAQRDLLMDIVGITCNIIILDEVLDNMDETATSNTLGMINSLADTVSSMFIISHNNYMIPYDKVLNVVKDKSRCSLVEVV